MATPSAPTQSFEDKHHFLLRKLHSLSGVVPVGVFLIEHLITNSMAAYGPEKFNKSVQFIADLPYLPLLEIFGIFLPLAFHAIYGIKIAMSAEPNVSRYPYMANWRYFLQRLTGYIAFLFLIVHLAKFRFAHWLGLSSHHFLHSPGGDFFATTHSGLMQWNAWGWQVPATVVLTLYFVGLASACFHFANGLWTFCISWGITVGEQAQKRVGVVAAGVGITLFALGTASLVGFATHKGKDVTPREDGGTKAVAEQAGPSAPSPVADSR